MLKVGQIPKLGFPLSFDGCVAFNTSISTPTDMTLNTDHVHLTSWGSNLMSQKVKMTNGFDFPIKVVSTHER